MEQHRVEDDDCRSEDTTSKGSTIPTQSSSAFCEETHKPFEKSVGKNKLARSVHKGDELIPGIIDDITLELIVPKFSWRDLHVLRSVSPSWQQAIRSLVVYESRVRSQSRETLAILAHVKMSSYCLDLSLYSLRDDTWSRLPSNPYLPQGIPRYSQIISLDGKLYVMGGVMRGVNELQDLVGSTEAYVLDLAGQKQWQKCADMLEPRLEFGCGVINGKIYIFGGTSHHQPVFGSEVYDSKRDTWSQIKSSAHSRVEQCVSKVGHELFVYGGHDLTAVPNPAGDGPLLWERQSCSLRLEAYDPVKDEWRSMSELSYKGDFIGWQVFTSQGKIYAVISNVTDKFCMKLYDIDKQAWTEVQSCFEPISKDLKKYCVPHHNIAMDNEVLGLSGGEDTKGRTVEGLLRSRGFGNEKEGIVWELCVCPSDLWLPLSICAVRI